MSSKSSSLVYVKYIDHVLFSRVSPLTGKPQIREAVGWLNYQCEEYIILSWDIDADPPTLKGGDPKASGLILFKPAILELTNLQINLLHLQKNSGQLLNCPKPPSLSEYAFQSSERKTRKTKHSKTKTGDKVA
jgi:hypothetical protein